MSGMTGILPVRPACCCAHRGVYRGFDSRLRLFAGVFGPETGLQKPGFWRLWRPFKTVPCEPRGPVARNPLPGQQARPSWVPRESLGASHSVLDSWILVFASQHERHHDAENSQDHKPYAEKPRQRRQ